MVNHTLRITGLDKPWISFCRAPITSSLFISVSGATLQLHPIFVSPPSKRKVLVYARCMFLYMPEESLYGTDLNYLRQICNRMVSRYYYISPHRCAKCMDCDFDHCKSRHFTLSFHYISIMPEGNQLIRYPVPLAAEEIKNYSIKIIAPFLPFAVYSNIWNTLKTKYVVVLPRSRKNLQGCSNFFTSCCSL